MATTISGVAGISTPSVTSAGSVTQGGVASQKMQHFTAQVAGGQFVDFTGIPSWAKRVTIQLVVSSSGVSPLILRLGAGSLQTAGYVSTAGGFSGSGVSGISGNITTGIAVTGAHSTADWTFCGHVVLEKVSGNTWIASVGGGVADGSNWLARAGGGYIPLPASLDSVRVTTLNGTDVFDSNGIMNILVEGY